MLCYDGIRTYVLNNLITKATGSMRWFLFLLGLLFVVTLAVVIGVRVQSQGHAFVLGLACGGAASVPASLLALHLTRRSGREQAQPARRSYPPLVIWNGPPPPSRPLPPDYPPLSQRQGSGQPAPRYRVIGGEEET
jgi:hypothetical protein